MRSHRYSTATEHLLSDRFADLISRFSFFRVPCRDVMGKTADLAQKMGTWENTFSLAINLPGYG